MDNQHHPDPDHFAPSSTMMKNDRRRPPVSPRNNESTTPISNAIRFAPRSPRYNQSQTINPTGHRVEPITMKSDDRFDPRPDSLISAVNESQGFYDRTNLPISATNPPFSEAEAHRKAPSFHRTGNSNQLIESHGNSQTRYFPPSDSHTNSINREVNPISNNARYPDQFDRYPNQLFRATGFESQNNQYNLTGDEPTNYKSTVDRESDVPILEDEEEIDFDDTINRLESAINTLRNSSEDRQLLDRLDKLERNVLSTLVVTNMMNVNGIKNNAQPEVFRLIENLSNYVHNDLLGKTSFRLSISQGLTATRDSLVQVMEMKFNESARNIVTRLSREDFITSNSRLKEEILAEIQKAPISVSLDSNLIEQIANSVQNTIQVAFQNKAEDSVTTELIRKEVTSAADRITATIDQKIIPAGLDYDRLEKVVSTIANNQLHSMTNLIKSEMNKTNTSIETLSQSILSLHDQVLEINNTHSKHIRIINNNISQLGGVISSIQSELKKLSTSEATNSKTCHSSGIVESRHARRKKNPAKSVIGNPLVLSTPKPVFSSSGTSKPISHSSSPSNPQTFKVNTFRSLTFPPTVVPPIISPQAIPPRRTIGSPNYSSARPLSNVVSPISRHTNPPLPNVVSPVIFRPSMLPQTVLSPAQITLPPTRATLTNHNPLPTIPTTSTPKSIKKRNVRSPANSNTTIPVKRRSHPNHSKSSDRMVPQNQPNNTPSEHKTRKNSENLEEDLSRKTSKLDSVNLSPSTETSSGEVKISPESDSGFVSSFDSNSSSKIELSNKKNLSPEEVETIAHKEEISKDGEFPKSDLESNQQSRDESLDSELADRILTRSFNDN